MLIASRALSGARVSRRAALFGVAALAGEAVVGCTPDRQARRRRTEREPEEEPQVDPDVTVAAEALANHQEMLDLLMATRRRHRELARPLAPVIAAHEAHAALLGDAAPPEVPRSPTTSASPSPDGSDRRRTRVPRDRERALEQVVQRERELTTATKRHAFKAQSGGFARLLGSMAAAAAQHATELESARSAS